jgi:3-hydroxy-9,10-secoandrosta-1,3,5(10)-triene-9,17-dione monooxygenase reductase component
MTETTDRQAKKHDLREIMGHYATGASVVTATWKGRPYGLAVNSLTSVSLEPPLVLFCPDKRSETWPPIRDAGHFVVNILAHDQDALCRTFAKRGVDRFADIGYHESPSGSPVLHDVLAYLECRIEAVHDGGDHFVTIGRVLDLGVVGDLPPLLFYRGGFRQLAGVDDGGPEPGAPPEQASR